jgi:hypothetical protein
MMVCPECPVEPPSAGSCKRFSPARKPQIEKNRDQEEEQEEWHYPVYHSHRNHENPMISRMKM